MTAHTGFRPLSRRRRTVACNQQQVETHAPLDADEVESEMLYTIAVILFALWLLGLVSSYTMGGFIHVLIVFAVVIVLMRVISGRRVAT